MCKHVSLYIYVSCAFLGGGISFFGLFCFIPVCFYLVLLFLRCQKRETERVCVDLDGRAGGEELEGVVEEETNQNIWYFKICFQ